MVGSVSILAGFQFVIAASNLKHKTGPIQSGKTRLKA